MDQWLRFHTPNAGGIGSIPGAWLPGLAKKKKKKNPTFLRFRKNLY